LDSPAEYTKREQAHVDEKEDRIQLIVRPAGEATQYLARDEKAANVFEHAGVDRISAYA
jgi:hypothetical protein